MPRSIRSTQMPPSSNGHLRAAQTADPAANKIPANCLLRGIPGTYSRFSAEATGSAPITDPIGQQWTPFAIVRADVASMSIDAPARGLQFHRPRRPSRIPRHADRRCRVPLSVHQRAVLGHADHRADRAAHRAPERDRIGKFPNEDAQSLIFDDSNLFKINKFCGWDRVEGGGRANVGCNTRPSSIAPASSTCCSVSPTRCSAPTRSRLRDLTNTGLGSGLDTSASDYVARVVYQPDRIYTFTSRFGSTSDNFDLHRSRSKAAPVSTARRCQCSMANTRPAAARLPDLAPGYSWQRSSSSAPTGWPRRPAATTSTLPNSPAPLGLGYIDDCFIFAVNYITAIRMPRRSGYDADARPPGHADDRAAYHRIHGTSQSVAGTSSMFGGGQ